MNATHEVYNKRIKVLENARGNAASFNWKRVKRPAAPSVETHTTDRYTNVTKAEQAKLREK